MRRLIRRTIESKSNYLNKPGRENYHHIISSFLERFTLCEVGTKKALQAYHKSNGEIVDIENVNMPMLEIGEALSYAGFDVKSMALDKMFRKNNIRGEKSVRDLRNAIVHDLTSNDIQELVDRWDEIREIMDKYLTQLQNEPLE